MDPITVAIIAALVTGAAAGTAQVVAEKIGGGAYTKLKQIEENEADLQKIEQRLGTEGT